MENYTRNHLFISYAEEDAELATWLTLKLTTMGYAVWFDKIKNLGGESYPTDIDDAIKNRTFRFIALLSHHSNNKPNPIKERTLAANISKERKEDFIIPINADGIKPAELNWMISDITHIPFYKGWAAGLDQLLKKLKSINTPIVLENGKEIAASEFLHNDFVNEAEEVIQINCLQITKIPNRIRRYSTPRRIIRHERDMINARWAFFGLDTGTMLSFCSPPSEIKDAFGLELVEEIEYASLKDVNNIAIEYIISNLLLKSLYVHSYKKGLRSAETQDFSNYKQKWIYFPKGLLEEDKIYFNGYRGNKTWIQVCGGRMVHRMNSIDKYMFYLSPRFKIRKDLTGTPAVSLTLHLYLTDENGMQLKRHSANARRKRICKNWWNHEWFNRYLAVLSFLSDGKTEIVIGEKPEEQIIIATNFVGINAPYGVDDDSVRKYREEFRRLRITHSNESSGDGDD